MQQRTYEKGIEQAQRETLFLLEQWFGTLSARMRRRIERMPASERMNRLRNLFHVT